MLYFIECMMRCISNGPGWNVGPLSTTGKPLTFKDASVGILGWLVVAVTILLILHIIKFSKNKNQDKSSNSEKSEIEVSNEKGKKSRNSKILNSIIYIFECMALGILCLRSGTNRIMYSTGEKVTKKEVVICVCIWIVVAIYIADIILILSL